PGFSTPRVEARPPRTVGGPADSLARYVGSGPAWGPGAAAIAGPTRFHSCTHPSSILNIVFMRPNAFAPTVLLALVFIASKAMLAWPYLKSRKDPSWLIGASAQDLLVALIFGAVAALVLR